MAIVASLADEGEDARQELVLLLELEVDVDVAWPDAESAAATMGSGKL